MEVTQVTESPVSRLLDQLDFKTRRARSRIDVECPGYSGRAHWNFFRKVVLRPGIRDICVLGVYNGRDIAYMSAILEEAGGRNCSIVGVDKFTDTPGTDWPTESQSLSWRQAGFGEPPELRKAQSHLEKLKLGARVSLHQAHATEFLKQTPQLFDFIYIDIAHDYEATITAIDASIPKLRPGGLIGGDDFSDEGTWGVSSAVKDRFENFQLFSNWIWLAQANDYRAPR
jgi:hypothetical protein